jgi:alcohol dehydrogenase, propanol-preferring
MRAMVLREAAPIESSPLHLRDVPLPVPAAGQVRISVRVCGLCHTDLHTVEGDIALPKLPITPGHQIVGIVDALGAGVKSVKEGDRVGVPWLYSSDGTCHFCRRGAENLCNNARFTGLHADGGYADAMLVDERFCYPIPRAFGDAHAAPLLCAGVIGYRSLRLSNAKLGDRLALYGFGASAHIVLQMARHIGCEIYVMTRTPAHRELALALGAVWTGTADATPPAPADAAIIFAPAGPLVLDALRNLRKGGTLALAGITMSQIPAIDYSLLYQERVVRSVANSTRDDVRECLHLAAEVPVTTEVESFPLEQANEALAALKHSRIRGAGVLRVNMG